MSVKGKLWETENRLAVAWAQEYKRSYWGNIEVLTLSYDDGYKTW